VGLARARRRAGAAYAGPVRLTEFWARMDRRFGPVYARSYAADQILSTLSGRTVQQALDDGDHVKLIWRAVYDAVGAAATDR